MQSLKMIGVVGINILILLSFFGIFFAAQAEESATTTNEEVAGEATLQDQQGTIEDQQNLRTERAGSLEAVRQSRVLNLSANISNRMEAVLTRLFTISERLSSRIEKITALGTDTNAAKNKLTEASEFLTQARINLANIDSLVYNATTSTEPKLGWENVRAVYTETARLIRSAHLALRETIALLKTAINRNLDQSTTTLNENITAETTE